MFAKGSRYRNLLQSSSVDAQGEMFLGTTLRVIPQNPGQFRHTVRDRDRLDLLGYKYYSDATRWWQICDANPQAEFPNDILDRTPLADAVLTVVQGDAVARYTALLTALALLGQVTAPAPGLPGDFVACPIIVEYAAPGNRALILAAIVANGFHLLRSFAWLDAGNTVEQFTIEDRAVKKGWQDLSRALRGMPGICDAVADMGTSTVRLTFNTAVTTLVAIQTNIAQYGFAAPPALIQTLDRVGSRIVIPPNGVA
jgi:hypothetical protein